jgi:5-(carboxyamino)imidazole ribonucleotide synthase
MADRHYPPLRPGSVIGILGGGQLGRMLALAAAELGFRTHIYCPDPDSPAFRVTDRRTIAPYEDRAALEAFARAVDIVTYEFENVPADTALALLRHVQVEPQPSVLDITQDRYTEKSFIRSQGLSVPAFEAVATDEEILIALSRIGYPAILKTRRFGYDGKGQAFIADRQAVSAAWASIGARPAILEAFVAFEKEISIVLARGRDGALRIFDIPENRHEDHILRSSTVPASIGAEAAASARDLGQILADALGLVGVMAIELFVIAEQGRERLIVNEIAPRVHNSGHWTQDACLFSQFDLHIRAIAGWPLPEPHRHCDVEMTNILGCEADAWRALSGEPHAVLHLYGKTEAREGRKMGHVNRLAPRKMS